MRVFIRISREIRINMHMHFYTFQKRYIANIKFLKAIPNVAYYEKNNPLRVVTADSPEIKILLEAVINLVKANTPIVVDIWVIYFISNNILCKTMRDYTVHKISKNMVKVFLKKY